MNRSLRSIAIIAVAAIAITGIWRSELSAGVLEFPNKVRNILRTFFVIIIGSLLLLCCRSPRTKFQTMDASNSGDPENLDPPCPERGWKAFSRFR